MMLFVSFALFLAGFVRLLIAMIDPLTTLGNHTRLKLAVTSIGLMLMGTCIMITYALGRW